MNKKLWLFPFIIIILTALAGCFGPPPPPPDYPETKREAALVVSAFESAVEGYNVPGMLGCLSSSDFKLIIEEAGHSVTKSYSALETELWADNSNQQTWRHQPGTDPDGHGYVLDLVLGGLNYYSTTASGTNASQTFEVWESAVGIDPIKTDQGTIIWKIVEDSGVWKAVEITIQYQALSGSGVSVRQVMNGSQGFGFSKLISR